MTELNARQKEFLISLHETLTKDLHEAQRNFVLIIIAVIGSIGTFGFGLQPLIETPCAKNAILFTISTIGFILLQILIIFLSNFLSYTYRQYQIFLILIEEIFCLSKGLPSNWYSNNKEPKKCEQFTDPPEIFKFFKRYSHFMILGVLIIYFLIILERFVYTDDIEMYYLIVLAIFVYIILFLCSCLNLDRCFVKNHIHLN